MAEPGNKPKVQDLSKEAQAIIETKTLSGSRPLMAWLKLLKELALFDERVDLLRAKAKKRAWIFLIIAIFSFFFTLVLLVPVVVFLPCLILSIYYFIKKRKYNEVDLDNEFRRVLIPFLGILAEDLAPGARLKIQLDMAGMTDEKIQRKEQVDPGRFRKVEETEWSNPWCRLEAPLVNGSRLIMKLENQYISQDRYWRNARGKSKHKRKWKKLVHVTAGIRPSDYWTVNQDQDAALETGKIKISESERGLAAQIRNKFKFSSVGEPPDVSVSQDDLVAMTFQVVGLLRPQTQAGASS